MKKVLVIAYEFPPVGGSGVQRTAKFVKYLPSYNWLPVVLTVKNPKHNCYDYTLCNEFSKDTKIYRTFYIATPSIYTSIKNILNLVKKLFPKSNNSKKQNKLTNEKTKNINPHNYFLDRFAEKIFTAIFIPDNRVGWLPFAILKSISIIKKEKPDIIYSTSLPITNHLIAYFIKKIFKKKWVADFRDDWVTSPHTVIPSRFHKKLFQIIEHSILKDSDALITVSEGIKDVYLKCYPDIPSQKITVIHNGYDEDDYSIQERDNSTTKQYSNKFSITYTGSFYGLRTPYYFLKALKNVVEKHPEIMQDIEINFVGYKMDFVNAIINDLQLDSIVKQVGYVEHKKSIEYLINSDVLLLIVGKGKGTDTVYTGKIFEYLRTGKPILALVSEGVLSDLLKKSNSGIVVEPDDIEKIESTIYELYCKHKSKELHISPNWDLIEQFSRKNLTGKLVNIFDSLR